MSTSIRAWVFIAGSSYAAQVLFASAVMLSLAGCGASTAIPSPEVRSWVDRAEAAESKRHYFEARSYYQNAVAAARSSLDRGFAEREYASALAFWGNYPEAEAGFERAVRADPKLVSAWHDLGILRARRSAFQEAEKALTRAVELAPREARSRIALAALLMKERKLDLAARHYRVLLTLEIPARIRRAVQRALKLIEAEKSLSG